MEPEVGGNPVPKGVTSLRLLPFTWVCVLYDSTCQPRPVSMSEGTSALNAIVMSSADGYQCDFGDGSEVSHSSSSLTAASGVLASAPVSNGSIPVTILPGRSIHWSSAAVPCLCSLGLGLSALSGTRVALRCLPSPLPSRTHQLFAAHTKFWAFSFLTLYYLIDTIFLLHFFNLVF